MRMKTSILALLIIFLAFSCGKKTSDSSQDDIMKIAFGSCGHEDHPLPIFDTIVRHDPDLFIFLGDNIYGDTKNMDTLRSKYDELLNKPSYQNLKAHVPIIATWDDHDYGWNDSGKEYPFKAESKEIFLDVFEEPEDSPRRNHEGIYTSYYYDYGGKTVQVILVDIRTFRDSLISFTGPQEDWRYRFYHQDYAPHTDTTVTILGNEQWKWLEAELKNPADLRIIGSGTQFGIEWNGYEAWANFPHEQQKMIDLIAKTKASRVVFITGDVHYSEVSKLNTDFYPLYDFTSSGLSSTWSFATPNANRIEGPIMDNHFGMITVDWSEEKPILIYETWDIRNNQRIEYAVPLSELEYN